MNYLFPVEGGARVHDWVSVCLSSEIPSEMLTREEFKFFIKDLVCKGEAIGMVKSYSISLTKALT